MVYVKFVKSKVHTSGAMKGTMNYCLRDNKVRDEITGRRMVSGINCNGENAYLEFMTTKLAYGKTDGIFSYQYVQSFSPEENISPQKAHEMAREFAEKAWPNHEILITTHSDTPHIHSHFIINSVSYKEGYKLRQDRHTIERLRKLSDEICIKNGYSIIKSKGRTGYMSNREYAVAMKGENWKFRLMNVIDGAMKQSGSIDEFKAVMKSYGYDMTWTDERKYITFLCPDGNKCRDIKLHDEKYLKRSIENELKYREQLKKKHDNSKIETSKSRYSQRNESDTLSADGLCNPGETTRNGNQVNTNGNGFSVDTIQSDMRESHRRGFGEYDTSGRNTYGEVGRQNDQQEYDFAKGDEWSYQTGREVEREIYLGNISNDGRKTQGTSRVENETAKSNDENNYSDRNNLGCFVSDGLHSLGSFANVIDNDSDDGEEQKKRRQARDAGAGLGLVIGTAAGIVSALVTKDSTPQELIDEQSEIEEEIDEGFDISM